MIFYQGRCYLEAGTLWQGFRCGSLVKNPPAMQEIPVQFLGWEDPLEKGKATHFSILGLENSVDCVVHGVTKSQTQLSLSLSFHFDTE